MLIWVKLDIEDEATWPRAEAKIIVAGENAWAFQAFSATFRKQDKFCLFYTKNGFDAGVALGKVNYWAYINLKDKNAWHVMIEFTPPDDSAIFCINEKEGLMGISGIYNDKDKILVTKNKGRYNIRQFSHWTLMPFYDMESSIDDLKDNDPCPPYLKKKHINQLERD